MKQELEYLEKRQDEKLSNVIEVRDKAKNYDDPNLDLDTKRRNFYESQSKHNPEFRKESQRFRQYLQVNTTLTYLINEDGGKSYKINKRGGWNKCDRIFFRK